VKISNDGLSHTFTLAIEGHASLISSATSSSYLDQKRFDPADASQDYTVSCANGDPAPSKANMTGWQRLANNLANQQSYGPNGLMM